MRRLAALTAILAALVVLLWGVGAGEDKSGTGRVAAIFDSASSLIPGQDVKVAGGRVGTVDEIELTPGRRARVTMELPGEFLPFRRDAECAIKPQSLIGEVFVQCDPGSPGSGTLGEAEDGVPTVPVRNTSAPVSLDLVFAAFRLPYRQRLSVILNELGTGLAGRGSDLNEVIRRANPTLRDFRDVLAVLDRQRADLRSSIADTDRILATLERGPEAIEGFIEEADRVTQRTARRHGELAEATRRLPGFLREAEPALRELDGLTVEATPVLADLRRSAPGVARLFRTFDPLADAARPALKRLGETAITGRRALDATAPVARRLRRVTRRLLPILFTARDLTKSLIAKGVPEGIGRFLFYAARTTARFDATSHILPAHVVISECTQYNTGPPIPGCSARFGTQGERGARRRLSPGELLPSQPPGTAPAPPSGDRPAPGAPRQGPASPGGRPRLPSLPELGPLPGRDPRPGVRDILDLLLGS